MRERCPDCSADWLDGLSCADAFHRALACEFEDPGGTGSVHHLTVLCYNLQHPGVYSSEGLKSALGLLIEFVIKGKTPADIRRDEGGALGQSRRTWKVTPRAGAGGSYQVKPGWTMTIKDVAAGGLDGYPERVKAWAKAVYDALEKSGNLL